MEFIIGFVIGIAFGLIAYAIAGPRGTFGVFLGYVGAIVTVLLIGA